MLLAINEWQLITTGERDLADEVDVAGSEGNKKRVEKNWQVTGEVCLCVCVRSSGSSGCLLRW